MLNRQYCARLYSPNVKKREKMKPREHERMLKIKETVQLCHEKKNLIVFI